MKVIAGLLLITLLSYGGWFYWQNFRGAPTAFLPTSKSVESTRTEANNLTEGVNKTSLPLVLPKGFTIDVFTSGMKKPRDLALTPDGSIVAADMGAGTIWLLANGTNTPLVSNLQEPHSVVFLCHQDACRMYVAESNALLVFDYDRLAKQATNKTKLVDLPSGGRHFSKTILLHPDGKRLLVSSGSSCDVCVEEDWRRAVVMQFDLETNVLSPFATGLRNSVFMATNPVDGNVWATEMGRDFLGDELPPDEVNILKENNHYGWPYCYGNRVRDVKFDGKNSTFNCLNTVPAQIELPAHVAPLGIEFVPEEGWPEEYRLDVLVGLHGSWNRSEPTGYKVVRLMLDSQGNYQGMEDFISGWLGDNKTTAGRPVDILALPGGTAYISDDKAGVVYRVTSSR